jgi:hypothetical protein
MRARWFCCRRASNSQYKQEGTVMNARYIVAAGILSILDLSAASAEDHTHGAICNPRPADINKIDYNRYGPHNVSETASATLTCHAGYATAMEHVYVTVADRHPSQRVCCSVVMMGDSADVRQAVAQKCTPIGASQTPTKLDFTQTVNGIVYVECTLPPHTSTGYSHLTSIRVQTPPPR